MLVSGGGKGKTWLLAQLAVCVATGLPLFDAFGVQERGAVLLALAEEDAEEVQRRLHQITRMLQLSPTYVEMIERNVVVLPLCGHEVALQESAAKSTRRAVEQELAETDFAKAIRRRLRRSGEEWRLVVFDPLSRFAGMDCELDNAAATRFVQILETFTTAPGAPTVLVAHHANKFSRSGPTNETAARGASALTDAVRWQANLDTFAHPKAAQVALPDFVELRIVKSNYGRIVDPVLLVRDATFEGALRRARPEERERLDDLRQAEQSAGPATKSSGGSKRRPRSDRQDARGSDDL